MNLKWTSVDHTESLIACTTQQQFSGKGLAFFVVCVLCVLGGGHALGPRSDASSPLAPLARRFTAQAKANSEATRRAGRRSTVTKTRRPPGEGAAALGKLAGATAQRRNGARDDDGGGGKGGSKGRGGVGWEEARVKLAFLRATPRYRCKAQ